MSHNSKSANSRSIREKAYDHIMNKIRSGQLLPGTTLSEVALARELGASRTPLREAIRQLVVEGFLRQTSYGVRTVAEFSKRDVAELYDLREALEVFAVGKAAERGIQPQDRESLEKINREIFALREGILQSGEQRLDNKRMERFVEIDLSFHAIFIKTAANRRILKAFTDTRVLLNVVMRRKGHNEAQLAETYQHHTAILAALARQDSEHVKQLMAEHIRINKEERLEEYDEMEFEIAMGQALSSII